MTHSWVGGIVAIVVLPRANLARPHLPTTVSELELCTGGSGKEIEEEERKGSK